MTDADFMRQAIQSAWRGLEKGEMPFGACIVKNGQILSVAHNSARVNLDTTALRRYRRFGKPVVN